VSLDWFRCRHDVPGGIGGVATAAFAFVFPLAFDIVAKCLMSVWLITVAAFIRSEWFQGCDRSGRTVNQSHTEGPTADHRVWGEPFLRHLFLHADSCSGAPCPFAPVARPSCRGTHTTHKDNPWPCTPHILLCRNLAPLRTVRRPSSWTGTREQSREGESASANHYPMILHRCPAAPT